MRSLRSPAVVEAAVAATVVALAAALRVVGSGSGLPLPLLNPDGLVCSLYYPDEVVSQDELDGLPSGEVEASDRELVMAQQLIEALSNEFDPGKYHDEYREELLALIDRKAEGAEVVELPERPAAAANVTDLMAALEASIAAAKQVKSA